MSLFLEIFIQIFTFFSIKQINILLAFFPSIYSLTFLVSLIYREYISKILKELYKIHTVASELLTSIHLDNVYLSFFMNKIKIDSEFSISFFYDTKLYFDKPIN